MIVEEMYQEARSFEKSNRLRSSPAVKIFREKPDLMMDTTDNREQRFCDMRNRSLLHKLFQFLGKNIVGFAAEQNETHRFNVALSF